MKLIEKIFIFGHCWNMLGRLLLHELKTFKFLACTDACTDFDESPSPTKRLYSNRQARNVFVNFILSTQRINYSTHGGGVVTYTLNGLNHSSLNWCLQGGVLRTHVGLGIGTTNKQVGATSYLKRSDTTNDRLRSLKKGLPSMGERGQTSFTSLPNFTPSCGSLIYK